MLAIDCQLLQHINRCRGVCKISHCTSIKQATARISIFLLSNALNMHFEFVAGACGLCNESMQPVIHCSGLPTALAICFNMTYTSMLHHFVCAQWEFVIPSLYVFFISIAIAHIIMSSSNNCNNLNMHFFCQVGNIGEFFFNTNFFLLNLV